MPPLRPTATDWTVTLPMMDAAAEVLKAGDSLTRQAETLPALVSAIRAHYGTVTAEVTDVIAQYVLDCVRPLMDTTFATQTADERAAGLLRAALYGTSL